MHLAGVSPAANARAIPGAYSVKNFVTSSGLFLRVCTAIYLAIVHPPFHFECSDQFTLSGPSKKSRLAITFIAIPCELYHIGHNIASHFISFLLIKIEIEGLADWFLYQTQVVLRNLANFQILPFSHQNARHYLCYGLGWVKGK